MSGSHRQLLTIVVILLLIGLLAGLWRSPDPVETNPGSEAPRTTNAIATPQSSAPDQKPSTTTRDLVAAPTEQPPGPRLDRLLRIRLVGIVPEVPWTEPLRFDLSGRTAAREHHELEDRLTVDIEGVATIELPDWVDELTSTKLRIECRDPNYRPIRHRRRDKVEPGELVIEVEHVRILTGRVVDAEGEPVAAARVGAFWFYSGRITNTNVGTTSTAQDGSYRLQVPPDPALAIVAAAMEPVQISGRLAMGYHGAIAETGILRPDLLPAWLSLPEPNSDAPPPPMELDDLVLRPAARIRGALRWTDGGGITGGRIRNDRSSSGQRLLWGQTFELSPSARVYHEVTQQFRIFASLIADVAGDFELAARPGERMRIEVVDIPEALCDGGIFFDSSPAPCFVECVVPMADLRATHRGKPVPNALFELSSGKTRRADENGRLSVAPGHHRVRARKEGLVSRWHQPGRLTGNPQTIDIELSDRLTPVTIHLAEGASPPPDELEYEWLVDGSSRTVQNARRESGSRYRAFVPRGKVRLRVGGGLEGFIVPTSHILDIEHEPIDLEVTPREGGRLVLEVDKRGTRHTGHWAITDAAGQPVKGRFWTHTRSGRRKMPVPDRTFSWEGPQTLEHPLLPGNYRIEVTALQTRETRDFTIRPRETTTVRVRLP
ncbi:MAG: carboxypeptidase-like regulatory domain-containing protein [bacterium]|nr:carboxypeptidase-like regulatory domain-containing protein [bacterium]